MKTCKLVIHVDILLCILPMVFLATNVWKHCALIRSGNPAVLFVSEEEYGGGHAVLATGYHYYIGGGGIYVHNDLVHGETWITTTYVLGYGAILELDR